MHQKDKKTEPASAILTEHLEGLKRIANVATSTTEKALQKLKYEQI